MAYKDARCTEPLEPISRGEPVQGGALEVDVALTDKLRAGHHGYDDMTFPGSDQVGGSNIVYWKAPDTDLNCMNIMMIYLGKPWGAATKLPGDIIINARKGGCYYSAIPVSRLLPQTRRSRQIICRAGRSRFDDQLLLRQRRLRACKCWYPELHYCGKARLERGGGCKYNSNF